MANNDIYRDLWMCDQANVQRLDDKIFIVLNINSSNMIFYDLNLDLSIEK